MIQSDLKMKVTAGYFQNSGRVFRVLSGFCLNLCLGIYRIFMCFPGFPYFYTKITGNFRRTFLHFVIATAKIQIFHFDCSKWEKNPENPEYPAKLNNIKYLYFNKIRIKNIKPGIPGQT